MSTYCLRSNGVGSVKDDDGIKDAFHPTRILALNLPPHPFPQL